MILRPASCFALACALLLGACQPRPTPATRQAATAPPATVLLISIDGLRASYLGQGDSPTLDRIATQGVRAAWMNPSYPSLTFPNHYTLVTGLRPDRHGMIHNMMQVEGLGDFKVSNTDATADSRWWSQAQPVWVTAEQAHLPTAIWAWPGSAAEIDGVRPTRYHLYDHHVSAMDRATEVAGWLTAGTPAQRPRLAALYFEMVDNAGHDHGPDAPQTRAAVRVVDTAIGHLLALLDASGLGEQVNVIVVSDHGMAPVPPANVIGLDEMVNDADAEWISNGQVVGFEPRPGRARQARAQLLGRHAHYGCWDKRDMPAHWHYGSNPRIPAIVCQLDEGWDALGPEVAARRRTGELRGSHGYAPDLPSMRAAFVARGPAFRSGVTLPAFDNVDVYPLLMHLLGLPPRDNDGSLDPLQPALRATTH
ncbi:MAG: ectonucleotide pyrophosphatase/phosphodiesterase [Pseudoxanthomonas sp.]